MKLRWRPRALRDLQDIRGYIAAHGSAPAADRARRHLRSDVVILHVRHSARQAPDDLTL